MVYVFAFQECDTLFGHVYRKRIPQQDGMLLVYLKHCLDVAIVEHFVPPGLRRTLYDDIFRYTEPRQVRFGQQTAFCSGLDDHFGRKFGTIGSNGEVDGETFLVTRGVRYYHLNKIGY